MHKDNRDHNAQREHKIYPRKTHLREKPSNLFFENFVHFKKEYNLNFSSQIRSNRPVTKPRANLVKLPVNSLRNSVSCASEISACLREFL